MPTEDVILRRFDELQRALGDVHTSIGALTTEVAGTRRDLQEHRDADEKRFRALEGTDAEITGQHKIDKALQDQVRAAQASRVQVATAIAAAAVAAIVGGAVMTIISHMVWR